MLKQKDSLLENLSQQALDIFEGLEGKDQKTLILNWMDSANEAQKFVSDVQLQKFFDEQLTPEQKERFDRMTPENHDRELLREYHRFYRNQRKLDPTPARPNRKPESGRITL